MRLFKRKSQEELEFEAKFDSQEKEIYVLTQDDMGAGQSRGQSLWTVSIATIAHIDIATQELVKKKCVLQWLVSERGRKTQKKGFGLAKQKIYKLKVRASLPFVHPYTHKEMEAGRWLMVVDVLERDCAQPQLQELLKEYQKEVSIQPKGCQKLVLNKSLRIFQGDGDFHGQSCSITLDADEEQDSAEAALSVWNELYENAADWDDRGRRYAAEALTDLANDWLEEDAQEVTQEAFMKRISIIGIHIGKDKDIHFDYDDDDMFAGHIVVLEGTLDKGFEDANIEG